MINLCDYVNILHVVSEPDLHDLGSTIGNRKIKFLVSYFIFFSEPNL